MDSLDSEQEDYIVGDKKSSEKRMSTDRFMKQTQKERGRQFTEWLMAEEREFLVRVSHMVDGGKKLEWSQIVRMR